MLDTRAGIQKMFVKIANRNTPDQTASSDLGLHCLSKPFRHAISISHFRTSTINSVWLTMVHDY